MVVVFGLSLGFCFVFVVAFRFNVFDCGCDGAYCQGFGLVGFGVLGSVLLVLVVVW